MSDIDIVYKIKGMFSMFEILMNLIDNLLFLVGYVSGGGSFPQPLSEQEEAECIKRMSVGDKEARNTLAEHNLRLVAHIAKKYANDNNCDDLISIGTIGLIKGINTFRPDKNPKLATYIARCIENEILMYMRTLKKQSGEVSLDECIGTDKEGNSMSLSDILPSDEEDISDIVSSKHDIQLLKSVMKKVLKKSEYDIISWRYGLFNTRRKTQREVAELLGISRSYVSRIEKKALEKLYEVLKDIDGKL